MSQSVSSSAGSEGRVTMSILCALSFSHMLNDILQALVPAIYPLLKDKFALSFLQIGIITLGFQFTSSFLQPLVGYYTDKRPVPYSLATGMAFSLVGLAVLAFAPSFTWLVIGAILVGSGSSIFHPEASRLARLASGGRHGFAQSFFQVGGNAGTAFGPLLAAAIIMPNGQAHLLWFTGIAALAIFVLTWVGHWYYGHLQELKRSPRQTRKASPVSRPVLIKSILILLGLIISKYFYLACMASYYTFFMIDRFQVSIQQAQVYLFVFMFAVAAGTIVGGPLGDRFGRRKIIWVSILGTSPFALFLPYASLPVTIILSACAGFILASAFSAILVYAQELVPGNIGMVTGLFFGFALGMGGVGGAVIGALADYTDIQTVFQICAFLPLTGILAGKLPEFKKV